MIGGLAIWVALSMASIASGEEENDLPLSRSKARTSWHAVSRPKEAISSNRGEDVPPRISMGADRAAPRPSLESQEDEAGRDFTDTGEHPYSSQGDWPADVADALGRLELARRAIVIGQAVEAWQFETVRNGYEAVLKAHRDNQALHQEIQLRLAGLSRLENAAEAARKIRTVLDRSHQRDQDLARLTRKIAAQEQAKSRSFRALGMIQPSARKIEGRKLYTLIAANGSTRAYLDVPPGIDAESLIARRVGVRGTVNYDDDLGARLITVRDIEELGTQE